MNIGIINALDLLQGEIKNAFKMMSCKTLDSVNEIRLRIDRNVSLSIGNDDLFILPNGTLCHSSEKGLVAGSDDIEHAFKTAFSYSLHSYSKELSQGYITTKGGNRVGICGTAVANSDFGMDTIKYISSINIRIAREKPGFAQELYESCFKTGISSVLIVGPPSSGKTTLLRDLSRLVGSKFRVSLIDERNELSATYRNKAQNDVGRLTDIFVGYPKSAGISTAVRVMSPKAVIVDEIGTDDDLRALSYALHSGVKLITAVHGHDYEDASEKACIKTLLKEKAFDYYATLDNDYCYKVGKID